MKQMILKVLKLDALCSVYIIANGFAYDILEWQLGSVNKTRLV
jgi:hypothetical protein